MQWCQVNSVLTIIHRKHLITKADSHMHITWVVRSWSQSWGLYSSLWWKPPVPGTTRCPCTNLLQLSFFFLISGEHSTVIQAVHGIHVSLQLSCRVRYLPPNSWLALCSFTSFTFLYMLKSIKDLIFPPSGGEVDAFWWKPSGGSCRLTDRVQEQKFYVQTFTCVSLLSGSTGPLTPLANSILIINS